ncbi:MAG: threonine/serine exporter family protein [Clostridia bacterium]|nr:threonine/serine exporter family protein [Clostridia bacterium]
MKEYVIQILAGVIGTLGFAIILNIRGKRLVVTVLGGFAAWTLFLLLGKPIPGEPIRYFIVALVISFYSELMARLLKTPTTTFITTALISLVPGGSLYYTMSYALIGNYTSFLSRGIHTLKLASALALGIIVAAAVIRIVGRFGKSKARGVQENK